MVTCFTVFYVIDGLATRPKGVEVEKFRKMGMNDEQVLAMALQKANAMEGQNIFKVQKYVVHKDRTHSIRWRCRGRMR